MADVNGPVAIISGASSGIGLAVARALVARGNRVALVARTKSKLEELQRELGAEQVEIFPFDVNDTAALLALPRRVVERFGRLDIVVNNAGVNHRGAVKDRSPAELAAIIGTNLTAPILLTQAALAVIDANGVIVNVASLAGKVPLPHEATYSASKAGLRAFSRALDLELGLHGGTVRIATVCPGPVDTGFFGDVNEVPDLVFSQPMSSAEQIAAAVLRAIDGAEREIDVPAMSGKLATLGYLSPRLYKMLRPALEKRGAKNKQRYIASKSRGT